MAIDLDDTFPHYRRMNAPSSMKKITALIVAAGNGSRAGGSIPKQYQMLAGKPLLHWTLDAFLSHPDVNKILLVVDPGAEQHWRPLLNLDQHIAICAGGDNRQASVLNGLNALEADAPDLVLIHDGARPFLSSGLISRLITETPPGGGAMPGLQVSDTLRRVEDDACGDIVPREGVWRAQTPQCFAFPAILSAHRAAAGEAHTDDVAIAVAAGLPVQAIEGEAANIKITTPDDLIRAEAHLHGPDIRVGSGYDVHRFGPGDHLWLGGVRIPHVQGLIGHSDADVVLHALTDAMLGAAGAGDIGQHFPPSDPQWRDAASHQFVAHACDLLLKAGGQLLNADLTIIAEAPKIGPHRDAMRVEIARITGLDPARVNIKATTTEKLGFTGRGEGLAAQAVVSARFGAIL